MSKRDRTDPDAFGKRDRTDPDAFDGAFAAVRGPDSDAPARHDVADANEPLSLYSDVGDHDHARRIALVEERLRVDRWRGKHTYYPARRGASWAERAVAEGRLQWLGYDGGLVLPAARDEETAEAEYQAWLKFVTLNLTETPSEPFPVGPTTFGWAGRAVREGRLAWSESGSFLEFPPAGPPPDGDEPLLEAAMLEEQSVYEAWVRRIEQALAQPGARWCAIADEERGLATRAVKEARFLWTADRRSLRRL
jgi:hypothetical protein